uniref:Uncharacterized protein n=1 Tax=Cladonia uncialis subsp. uncialis TaxID=180999 RepID=A0A2K9YCX7_CLAUC|nr:hypothetical protein [Cladonia uncialis subsp. uncialis]
MYTGRGSPPRGKTTTSLLKRARTAPANQSNLTQQTVSSYRLQWDKLRRYLETRFSQDNYPNYVFDFKERKINKDRYVFMVPEALNSVIYFNHNLYSIWSLLLIPGQRDDFEIELLRDPRTDNALDREQSLEP